MAYKARWDQEQAMYGRMDRSQALLDKYIGLIYQFEEWIVQESTLPEQILFEKPIPQSLANFKINKDIGTLPKLSHNYLKTNMLWEWLLIFKSEVTPYAQKKKHLVCYLKSSVYVDPEIWGSSLKYLKQPHQYGEMVKLLGTLYPDRTTIKERQRRFQSYKQQTNNVETYTFEMEKLWAYLYPDREIKDGTADYLEFWRENMHSSLSKKIVKWCITQEASGNTPTYAGMKAKLRIWEQELMALDEGYKNFGGARVHHTEPAEREFEPPMFEEPFEGFQEHVPTYPTGFRNNSSIPPSQAPPRDPRPPNTTPNSWRNSGSSTPNLSYGDGGYTGSGNRPQNPEQTQQRERVCRYFNSPSGCVTPNCAFSHVTRRTPAPRREVPANSPCYKCQAHPTTYDQHYWVDCPGSFCSNCGVHGHSYHRCPKTKCPTCGQDGHSAYAHGVPKNQ